MEVGLSPDERMTLGLQQRPFADATSQPVFDESDIIVIKIVFEMPMAFLFMILFSKVIGICIYFTRFTGGTFQVLSKMDLPGP